MGTVRGRPRCGTEHLRTCPPGPLLHRNDREVAVERAAACTMSVTRSKRIDLRVTDAQDTILRQAAEMSGDTLTAFVLSAAEERARRLLGEHQHIVLRNEVFDALARSLDEAPAASAELAELMALPPIPAR